MFTREEARRIGKAYGFEVVRFSSTEPFEDYKKELKKRISNGLYPPEVIQHEKILQGYENSDPTSIDNDAKTIIALAYHYYTDETVDKTRLGEPHGVLARNYMKDFYGELRRNRDAYADSLRKMGLKVTVTDRLPLKQVALRAGIGWQGKNCLILNREYGSWMNLQALLVDAELEPDQPMPNGCGGCQACINSCPMRAIISPGVIDVNRCIDFLTCRPGLISEELQDKMGNRIVGCDRCQEVCSYNSKPMSTRKKIPRYDPMYRESPELIPLLSLDQEGFMKHFGDCDIIDDRLDTFKRNVIIALGNIGDPVAINELERIDDGDPVISETRDWAIQMIKQRGEPSCT